MMVIVEILITDGDGTLSWGTVGSSQYVLSISKGGTNNNELVPWSSSLSSGSGTIRWPSESPPSAGSNDAKSYLMVYNSSATKIM